jgi:hypothetical protein
MACYGDIPSFGADALGIRSEHGQRWFAGLRRRYVLSVPFHTGLRAVLTKPLGPPATLGVVAIDYLVPPGEVWSVAG